MKYKGSLHRLDILVCQPYVVSSSRTADAHDPGAAEAEDFRLGVVMGKWEFNKADLSDVDIEMTQRDQFNNDDVSLSEALVREVIQNSLDAALSDAAVKVRFGFVQVDGHKLKDLENHLSALLPHLHACGLSVPAQDAGPCRFLVIEDFNTKGLTGKTAELDDDNFRNFWRRHGRSSKKGKHGGRWGLGKLVYSSSSAIRVFYGLTVRDGEHQPLLMGQAVLANHDIDGMRYHAHGFWFSNRAANRLQLPITDEDEIAWFRPLTGIQRTDQSGLSIAIPYVAEGIDYDSIIIGILTNYYFPILAGKLEVDVGDIPVNKNTFLEVAERSGAGQKTGVPFDFIREISQKVSSEPDSVACRPIGSTELAEDFFPKEDVGKMMAAFSKGDLVHARVPVRLKRKNGEEITNALHLFLRRLPEGRKSFALYARGPITLPGERRYFGGSPAYGALVVNGDEIAEFLGDAENPAHTAWNSNAEKLSAKWSNRQAVLRTVRYSLRNFFGIIADQVETEDRDALIDFFALADQGAANRGRRKRSTRPRPEIPPRETAIAIRPRTGGFDLVPGPGAARWEYPKKIRIRLAYDMIGGNPFRHHSRFDFDLHGSDISLSCKNATANLSAKNSNVLMLTAKSADYRLEARGFDPNRDLVVDARAV